LDSIEDLFKDSSGINKVIDFEIYSSLFSNDTYYHWNHLWEMIRYTKSYDLGLEISIRLLNLFEMYRDRFTKEKQESQLFLICLQFLQMLDFLDRWEDYIKYWEIIKEKSMNEKIGCSEYSKDSKDFHFNNGGEKYFLYDTQNGFKLSFMYGMEGRRNIIQKKLEKAKNSKKIKNLLHEQQSDFTYQEIKERYDWLIKFFKTGQYDFNPPASKQKEQKRKEKQNNIKMK
jgi:hypothetical protein